ncbi:MULTISPECIES: nucleotide exchange factor GrpE [Nitratireductor]|uniref:nucleotide exchange factor GrpE n=1 Tax=Nitratireductor TaxID=245876 RepID=UPI000D0E1859|nr:MULTISPECIES: nucleotide exchange factor GrpE [Nitratireductor]PSM19416.1 nucleotide exchange factor GrpE [Nitratireductor sp. StC3]
MNDHPKNERGKDDRAATSDMEAAKSHYAEMGGEADTAETGQDGGFEAEREAFLKLAKENEELKDRALRLAAEMENLRRRTARDVQDARAYAIANFARDMLTVCDDLRRAIDAVPAEARERGEAGLVALIDGVEMTERSMHAALERHGVKKIDPDGEKFDPNFHQAMFEVPNPEVPASTVVQVVQSGYVIGERVLRPAMVGVAKGGPKAAAKDEAAEPGPVNEQAEKDA